MRPYIPTVYDNFMFAGWLRRGSHNWGVRQQIFLSHAIGWASR